MEPGSRGFGDGASDHARPTFGSAGCAGGVDVNPRSGIDPEIASGLCLHSEAVIDSPNAGLRSEGRHASRGVCTWSADRGHRSGIARIANDAQDVARRVREITAILLNNGIPLSCQRFGGISSTSAQFRGNDL